MSEIHAAFTLTRKDFSLDVNFYLPSKGVSALFGPSGSGKTTLLRCMAGLDKADSGHFIIGKQCWQDGQIMTPAHQREVGYVFQESNLFTHLSVEQNLLYGFKRIAPKHRQIPFEEAVYLLGLQKLLTQMPSQLSGGQRQRVAIARALLTSPKLLLMDEPLASLDFSSKADILPYLEQLNDGLNIPIVYVSHSPDEVIRIANHMVLLDEGRVLAEGPVNELLTRTDLPLAHLEEACAVLEGTVVEHDRHYHLTHLALAGGKVAVSYNELAIDEKVRVRILARDVSLTLIPNQQSSIANVFPVRITNISKTRDPAKVIITLDMAGDILLAQITARSADFLNLKSGQNIYAQVKSVALMR